MQVPVFKKTHLAVKKCASCFLAVCSYLFPVLLALSQYPQRGIKYLLYRTHPVRQQITLGLILVRRNLIVSIEIIYPKCIQMWMDRHMQNKRVSLNLTIHILVRIKTWLALRCCCHH